MSEAESTSCGDPAEPPGRVPRHVAIIMDGNGRWAEAQGLPRTAGHQRGVEAVEEIIEAAGDLGIKVLTLYAFSIDNWKRPSTETDLLMELLCSYLAEKRKDLVEKGIRLRVIGERERLPENARDEIAITERETAGFDDRMLVLALSYGSQEEIVRAARLIARDAADGGIDPDQVDGALFSGYLYTKGIPDPDLLIRTAGEMRLSNFLLYQMSYTEIWVTAKCWPDFGSADLAEAVSDFGGRNRKFGGLS